MYFKDGEAQIMEISPSFKWTLGVLAVLVVLLGIFPQMLFHWYYF
jgi:NADH-quinone oxidoreductase subunit N